MAANDITTPTIVTETGGLPYATKVVLGMAITGVLNTGMGANNDPANATATYMVTRPGFDATGAATTYTDPVYETRLLRKAWPNDAQNDVTASGSDAVIHSAISDFIHSGDTVTVTIGPDYYDVSGTGSNAVPAGTAVTNSSTNTYPKCILRSLVVPHFRATGSIRDEVIAAHRSARNGKPVACVIFTYSDQHGHSVSFTVATPTLSDWVHPNGLRMVVYAVPNLTASGLVAAGLTDGDVITRTAKAIPWIGNAGSVFDSATSGDGIAQPDEREGPFTFLLDSSGANLPPLFIVVDSATGNDTTGSPNTDLTTATLAANRVVSDAGAHTKAAAVRPNGENVFIYHVDNGGTGYAFNGSANAWNQATPARVWTTYAPHPTLGTKAGCPISSGDNSNAAGKIRFSGMKLSNTSIGAVVSDGNGLLWFDNSLINLTGSVAAVYQWRLAFVTDCSVTGWTTGLVPFGSSKFPPKLVRGNTFSTGASLAISLYCAVANSGDFSLAPVATGNSASQQISSNVVVAYNKLTAYSDTGTDWCKTDPNTAHANWLVACNAVACAAGARSQSLVNLKGDSDQAAGDNFQVWHNALKSPTDASSARANLWYNSKGTSPYSRVNCSLRGNNLAQLNNKTDTFTGDGGASGNRTGAWPAAYGLGFYSNVIEDELFDLLFDGLYTKDGVPNSYTNVSAGDLTPTSSSPSRNLVPAGKAVLPYDLAGNPFDNTGHGTAGPYQYAADIPAPAAAGGAFIYSGLGLGVMGD
jgi:hypothetical protein